MSEVNHRRNGKVYDKRGKERKGCGEVLFQGAIWIPECDIKYKRRIDRRKIRHAKIELADDDE